MALNKLTIEIELTDEEYAHETERWVKYVTDFPDCGFNTLEKFLAFTLEVEIEDNMRDGD